MEENKEYKTEYKLDTQDIEIKLENYEALAKKYRPVILSNIKRIHKMHLNQPQVEYDDLYQEGLIALYESIKNFKPDKGVYFGVYLKVAISNRLKCFCRNFLPHRYMKDKEQTDLKGKPQFKRIPIQVSTLDDVKSYLL
jgi:RNA polymerase sigma factor (sigma-70 family)